METCRSEGPALKNFFPYIGAFPDMYEPQATEYSPLVQCFLDLSFKNSHLYLF